MPQGKSMEIFATRADLLTMLLAVETQGPVTYAQTGLFEEDTPRLFARGADIPSLGISASGSTGRGPFFMAFDPRHPVRASPIPQRAGGVLYAVDQKDNPHTVVLKPGGMYKEECLIAGQIGTISDSSESIALYGRFAKHIKKAFARVRSNWLGP